MMLVEPQNIEKYYEIFHYTLLISSLQNVVKNNLEIIVVSCNNCRPNFDSIHCSKETIGRGLLTYWMCYGKTI